MTCAPHNRAIWIADDDTPTLSIGPANVVQAEGNTGDAPATDFTFTVKRGDYERALELLTEVQQNIGARELSGDNKIAKVSVVGVGMRSHAGVATRMFDALAAENINILMISTSFSTVSFVTNEEQTDAAVAELHESFRVP